MPDTFSWDPDYTYNESIGQTVEIIDYESGLETRLLKGLPQRAFTIRFDHTTKTIKDELLAFFELHQGKLLSFYFVNPNDSITYEVYFSDDTISMTSDGYDYWNMEFKLIERMK